MTISSNMEHQMEHFPNLWDFFYASVQKIENLWKNTVEGNQANVQSMSIKAANSDLIILATAGGDTKQVPSTNTTLKMLLHFILGILSRLSRKDCCSCTV